MNMTDHAPLPVAGYTPQSDVKVSLVNTFKHEEEMMLRRLDQLAAYPGNDKIDQRWLAIGRTQLEQAFMSINRSVFQPSRVKVGS